MIWQGTDSFNVPIRVKAHKGDTTKPVIADIDNIAVGDEVTISGFAGAPADVIWEILSAGTDTVLGQSKFHIDCTDPDMSGVASCGELEGDGKDNKQSIVNMWVFDGMGGNGQTLDCTPDQTACPAPTPPPFPCTDAKPINQLTMIWQGTGALAVPIRVRAYKGDPTKPLVADIDNIQVGDDVTIAGFAGSPADIVWDIFAAGTTTKIGQSTFHIDCGDPDMNGREDCGKPEGDGKDNKAGFVNQWVLDGMGGNGVTLDCSPPPPPSTSSCEIPSGGGTVNYTYTVTNTGGVTANNLTVSDDKCAPVAGSPISSLPPGGTATLSCSQSVQTTTLNTVTVSGSPSCSGSAVAAAIAPCSLGYPYASSNPRTGVLFNESEVLRAFAPSVAGPSDRIRAFYNDEHAMLLGVSTQSFPVSPFSPPSGKVATFVLNPQIGDLTATDVSGRPFFPSLFITDVTAAPGVICTAADPMNSTRCHDWQWGGTPISPTAVFGTWKSAFRSGTSIVTGNDPAKNNYNLDGSTPCPGPTCPDLVPAGLKNEGYGTEVRWDVSSLGLVAGHVYRMQFMVHDGDQNKAGGDVGQGCATVFIPRQ